MIFLSLANIPKLQGFSLLPFFDWLNWSNWLD